MPRTNAAQLDATSDAPVTDEFLNELAAVLGLTESPDLEVLARNCRRYVNGYRAARRRALIVRTPGETKAEANNALQAIARLQRTIKYFETSDWVTREYKMLSATKRDAFRASYDGLRFELEALSQVCANIARSEALPAGSKGDPIRRRFVGAFAALFERLTGSKIEIRYYREGDKGQFLGGAPGEALKPIFRMLEPNLAERSLAEVLVALREQYPDGLRERYFHVISGIEEDGGFTVSANAPKKTGNRRVNTKAKSG